ncbi:MAG: radical SAM protein [Desulfurobacteriaceae bacterium]
MYTLLNSIEGVSCDLIFSDYNHSFFLSLSPTEFDVIAFSVTYENHLFEVIKLLSFWGIEPLREKRKEAPLLLGGGIGLFYNPSPFLPVFDAIYLGEAEGRLEEVISAFRDRPNLEVLSDFDNVLISGNYTFKYEGLKVSSFEGPKKRIFRSPIFPEVPSHSCFISEGTAFKEMFLIELNRGCIEKCRFCVASYMGLPYREKEIEVVEEEIAIASNYVDRVGLIGAGVSDYSKMEELYRILKRYNVKASFSSLKASSASPYIFEILKESGQKTVTLAPEAGSQELRFAINKKVEDEAYFRFAERAFEAGAESLKLYFLIGLPGETEEDLEAIVDMTKKFREIGLYYWRERGVKGEIHLSVNPVIAKPFTPLQWYGLNPKSVIEKKIRKLSKLVRKVPGVKLTYEKVKDAVLQAIVSRGDERLGVAAVRSVKEGLNFRRALKEVGLPFEELYTRERERDELFPWEIVESGIRKDYLWREYQNVYKRKATPTCFPGCSVCGLCPGSANLQKG